MYEETGKHYYRQRKGCGSNKLVNLLEFGQQTEQSLEYIVKLTLFVEKQERYEVLKCHDCRPPEEITNVKHECQRDKKYLKKNMSQVQTADKSIHKIVQTRD